MKNYSPGSGQCERLEGMLVDVIMTAKSQERHFMISRVALD